MVNETGTGSKVTQVSDLDFGDPLYLHASDTSTTALVSLKLKGTENYNVWSRAMLLALQTKNKVGFINGSVVRHKTDPVLGMQWDRCNSVVLSWILNSISEELFSGQVFSQSAQTVWEELQETYDEIDGSITFNLHHNLNTLTQNGSSVSDYYHKLNSLWKQFDALIKLPTCTCHASKEFKDHNDLIKLMQFLMGLDDTYLYIRSNILSREPLPSVKTAFAIVSREESHRGSSQNGNTNKNQSSAFLVSKTFDNKKTFGRGSNPDLKCFKCNRLGHTIERCYEIVGYPPGWVKRNNNNNVKSCVSNNCVHGSSTTSISFTQEQMSRLISLIGDKSESGNVQADLAGFESKDDCGDW